MPSWAGGWDNVVPYGSTGGYPYALLNEPSAAARGIARITFPTAQRDMDAVAVALNGAIFGANQAVATQAYVTARQTDGMNLGGQVPITQVSLINRPTTAIDIAQLNRIYQPVFGPTFYPVEKSGNSGGGKLGTIN